jgi:hypothetical protein
VGLSGSAAPFVWLFIAACGLRSIHDAEYDVRVDVEHGAERRSRRRESRQVECQAGKVYPLSPAIYNTSNLEQLPPTLNSTPYCRSMPRVCILPTTELPAGRSVCPSYLSLTFACRTGRTPAPAMSVRSYMAEGILPERGLVNYGG